MKKIILIFCFWLVIVNLFAVLVNNRIQLKNDQAYAWLDQSKEQQVQSWNPISLHSRWDSFWYLSIAEKGYSLQAGQLSNLVFFPLYPALLALGGLVLMGNLVLAGWILSSILLLLSLIYLYKLAKEFHPQINPLVPVFLLLIFPKAFLLNAVYTESLFLLLSILVFYFSHKKKYWWAGLFGFLASLTRINGFLLFIPLVWEFIKDKGWKNIWRKSLPAIFLPLLGTFSFFCFHYFKYGDFFLFLKLEKIWGRDFKINWDHFIFNNPATISNFGVDLSFLVIAIIGVVLLLRRRLFSYALYVCVALGLALSTGTLMSIGRYVMVLFPLYLGLATVKNQFLRYGWVLVSILLFSLEIILFVNGYWAG